MVFPDTYNEKLFSFEGSESDFIGIMPETGQSKSLVFGLKTVTCKG